MHSLWPQDDDQMVLMLPTIGMLRNPYFMRLHFNVLRPAAGAGVQPTHSSLQSHHLAMHSNECILDSSWAYRLWEWGRAKL